MVDSGLTGADSVFVSEAVLIPGGKAVIAGEVVGFDVGLLVSGVMPVGRTGFDEGVDGFGMPVRPAFGDGLVVTGWLVTTAGDVAGAALGEVAGIVVVGMTVDESVDNGVMVGLGKFPGRLAGAFVATAGMFAFGEGDVAEAGPPVRAGFGSELGDGGVVTPGFTGVVVRLAALMLLGVGLGFIAGRLGVVEAFG